MQRRFVAGSWALGVFEDVFCAGKEETFAFLTQVLDQVCSLFPDSMIHLGAMNAPKVDGNNVPPAGSGCGR